MKKTFPAGHLLTCAIAFAAAGFWGMAHAQTVGPHVALGTDYLVTGAGTQFNSPYGPIPLRGKPLPKMGQTDTIIERLEDADLAQPAPIPIMVKALSLQSIGPVNINGSMCLVTVGLNKASAANSTGTMTITRSTAVTPPNGTFDSTLTIFYVAKFVGTSTASKCPGPLAGVATFTQTGGKWQSKSLPGEFLVTGPDNCTPTTPPTQGHCLGTADQAANQHVFTTPLNVDFYIVGSAVEQSQHGVHVVCEAPKAAAATPCQ